MKQSMSRKNRDTTAFLYPRLSRDDKMDGESYSISNQKKLLTKAAKDMGYKHLVTFCDDGVSGVTMNRPGFNEMMKELEKGHASAVFVKDMSRLGRNYLEVGRLMEEFFPENDIRLVAVSDGIDTAEGENELTPIRNLFNEWYARDISKKRRISNKIRGNAGEPIGRPPYGYQVDPNNSKRWVVDPVAAAVVRQIYEWTLDGFGPAQIAGKLMDEEVLNPTAYWQSIGVRRSGKKEIESPTRWGNGTIIKILTSQEYCGDVINFKTYSKSYKLKKRIENDKENWAVFKDVHEAIIDRTTWEKIQEKRGNGRKRTTRTGQSNMFSGFLTCADCGHALHFHFNQGNPDITYFNCSNYNRTRGTCNATHYIRTDFLEQVVLAEIRRLTKFVAQHEKEFAEAMMAYSAEKIISDLNLKRKELNSYLHRDKELDVIFEKLYEDNVSGKISDERFAKMGRSYEDEQAKLSEKIKSLRATLDKAEQQQVPVDTFISIVRRYTRIKKLTPRMVNELIDHIEVFHAEKIAGVWEQKLIIHYNCIGSITIPEAASIPVPNISVNTRKGVYVNYASN